MNYIVNNIKLSIDDDKKNLKKKVSKKLRVPETDIIGFKILKESIDARNKKDIKFIYSIDVELVKKTNIYSKTDIVEEKLPEQSEENNKNISKNFIKKRPIIIGAGPAGLFAALTLAKNGYKPLIIEQGGTVEERTSKINLYWEKGILDENTNVQFGEGGAGTFSDGKLTTRINDKRCTTVLNEFYKFNAPEEILYKAKPHIGSDILKKVIVNMRKEICRLGGDVKFNTKMVAVNLRDNKLCSIKLGNGDEIDTDILILAIGHSSRDTFKMLFEKGIKMERKPFSIGVRIEHPQELVNISQFGDFATHPKLGPADYQLFNKAGARTAYSFCMCPGGIVVAAASERNTIVTNGMSNFLRNEPNANSAFVVSVTPDDFGGNTPLAGIEFQRTWEKLAYKLGGGCAPIQTLYSFLNNKVDKKLGTVKPSYTGETKFIDLNDCLPKYVTDTLKFSVKEFSKKLSCFSLPDAILTGVETRTSSPIRIPRNSEFEADGIQGIYPCGEGAGYAGGIVSAAVDGIKIAEKIIQKYEFS